MIVERISKCFNFLKMVNINLNFFEKKKNQLTCASKIDSINVGLSRTGTQSYTKLLEKQGYRVFNSIQHYKNKKYNTLLLKYLKSNKIEDFQKYYYFILNNNFERLFISDIPLNFFYEQIISMPEQKNSVIYYTHRHFDYWKPSFEKLIETFAPLFGLPFSLFMDREYFKISTMLFEKFVNCKITCYNLFGFCLTAYIQNIDECKIGYNKYYKKIMNQNEIQIFNLTHKQNMSVTSYELTYIYILLLFFQILFIICIFVIILVIFNKKKIHIKKKCPKK